MSHKLHDTVRILASNLQSHFESTADVAIKLLIYVVQTHNLAEHIKNGMTVTPLCLR